jgi:hypothetical protein
MMEFDLDRGTAVLERTPGALRALLHGLPPEWVEANEGPDTWSPFDVLGHLIHGERTDWIARARILLEHGESRAFDPFDRFAMFRESRGKTLAELLETFAALRAQSLQALRELGLAPVDLRRTGKHPDLGVVTLGQLLATWVVHDLGHLAQIARTMAKQYAGAAGPWAAYLPVLGDRRR